MKNPRVGLSVIVLNAEDKVLLGKRKNAHGDGTWAFPGGRLEPEETFYECVLREMKEETDINIHLKLKHRSPIAITNDIFKKENQHWITLFFKGYSYKQEPKLMEPNKCERWRWYEWKEINKLNLFLPINNLIKQGYNPIRR